MANIVARIKLAPGETGFYNEPAGIYLNWDHPIADVSKDADLNALRKAVKDKHIIVIEGSLGTSKTFKQILMEAKSKRTGEPLEKLMGDTPLASEPTEFLDEKTPAKKEKPKKTETIEVVPEEPAKKPEPPKKEPEKVEEKPAEEVVEEQPEKELAEEAVEDEAPKKKVTRKKAATKKADKEAEPEA